VVIPFCILGMFVIDAADKDPGRGKEQVLKPPHTPFSKASKELRLDHQAPSDGELYPANITHRIISLFPRLAMCLVLVAETEEWSVPRLKDCTHH